MHRALVRYGSPRHPQTALRARLWELAATKVRWGSPRLTWRLRREGWPVNHKRIERLMREERLLVPQRRRRKRAAMARVPTPGADHPRYSAGAWTSCATRWSMDAHFVSGPWSMMRRGNARMLLVERSLPAVRVVDGAGLAAADPRTART